MVLILAGKADPQARRVVAELGARGYGAVCLDTAAFPEETTVSYSSGVLSVDGQTLGAPRSVYLRGLAWHPLMPGTDDELAERPRGFIAQCDEKRAMLESLVLMLETAGARIVNSLDANAQHSQKPYQLELLRRAGLPVPRSLATNDPDAVRGFLAAVKAVVYKPLSGGATVQHLQAKDLGEERMAALANAPVLFQEYVSGTSIRAYVVGGRVVAAAEILSPELDYRRDERAVVPTRLEVDEQSAAIAAAKACGMAFTGIDLIRTAQGFTVLECNPSPMFAVFEQKTGTDVAGPLAELLIACGRAQ